jgi:formamidopyrimidine-DNA glycosylase
MPELPEVETTRRGIAPHIEGCRVSAVTIRQRSLRWPVTAGLEEALGGQKILSVERRAKYLLLITQTGVLLVHLGMSGSLRVVGKDEPVRKHDHADIVFAGGQVLRFHDPRRFGCLLWLQPPLEEHPLLAGLGPEPLSDSFSADYLFKRSRKRSVPVKSFIMDGHVVVGVGNIYANEALFAAGIAPDRKAGSLSRARYVRLVEEIKQVLGRAIEVGGTTLRDFVGGTGEPGYFKQSLAVYGRGGAECLRCRNRLVEFRLGQRSTVYCPQCQR